jgi:hypothetical protein
MALEALSRAVPGVFREHHGDQQKRGREVDETLEWPGR